MKKILIIIAFLCGLCSAQEIRRPNSETSSSVTPQLCTGTWGTGTLPNFWDSDPDSFSTQSIAGTRSANQRFKAARLYNFTSASGTYSALSLKIDWSCAGTNSVCQISYSTNGGASFAIAEKILSSGTRHTVTVSLNSSQDLSQLLIQWEACGDYDPIGEIGLSSTLTGYDVRTEGTLASTDKKRFQVTTTE